MSEKIPEGESQARRTGTVSKAKQAARSVAHLQKILQMQYFQIAARRQASAESVAADSASSSVFEEPVANHGSGYKLFALLLVLGLGAGAYMLIQDRSVPAVEPAVSVDVPNAEETRSSPQDAQTPQLAAGKPAEKEAGGASSKSNAPKADVPRRSEQELRAKLEQSAEGLRVSEKVWFEEKFVLIPGGSFQMGSRIEPNNVIREVTLPDFWMDSTEVTLDEWKRVRDWAQDFGYVFSSEGSAPKPDCPVAEITWYDAARWCNAKSEMSGLRPCYYIETDRGFSDVYCAGQIELNNAMVDWEADGYRLPTEAEWEKSARGNLVGKRYPNGDKLTGKDANHSLNHVGPRPVKSYPPNGFGLYEMAGNVWEWVWDWYAGDLSALTDDPRGPLSGERRVIRGGGSSGSPDSCGVAVRVSMRGDVSLNTGGFRVVRRFKQSEAR